MEDQQHSGEGPASSRDHLMSSGPTPSVRRDPETGEEIWTVVPLDAQGRTTEIESSRIIGVFPKRDNEGYIIITVREKEDVVRENQGTPSALSHIGAFPDGIPMLKLIHTTPSLPERLIKEFASSMNFVHPTYKGRTTVMVSKKSGAGLAEPYFRFVLSHIYDMLGWQVGVDADSDYHAIMTSSATSIAEWTTNSVLSDAMNGRMNVIALMSGDGGVVDMINALYRGGLSFTPWTNQLIAILPLGTGNALSNSLNYNRDKTYGLSTLLRGQRRPLRVFRVTFSPGAKLVTDEGRGREDIEPFADKGWGDNVYEPQPTIWGAVVCSWGLHAALVADSDTAHYRQFGAERFKMAAGALLSPEDGSEPHEFKGTVSYFDADDETGIQANEQTITKHNNWKCLDGKTHSYVLATMVEQLEKGFCISPASKSLDGKMRLVHLGPMSGDEIMNVMNDAYSGGKHVDREEVGYHEIGGMKIDFDEPDERWRRVCVDGKIIAVEEGGWVEVRTERQTLMSVIYSPPVDEEQTDLESGVDSLRVTNN